MRNRLDVRTLLFVALIVIIIIVGAMSYFTLTTGIDSNNVRTDSPKYSDSATAMVTLYVLPAEGDEESGT